MNDTVMLLGESGTGKELLAEALHTHRKGGRGPYIVVDCGSIPEGLAESELFGHKKGAFPSAGHHRPSPFEDADGGTIFLDEIGELPLKLQPLLLRAIEKREIKRFGENHFRSFKARIVTATNRNLRAQVQVKGFREDLYHRLSVMEMHVPSLRERKEDIPLLVSLFLSQRDPPCTLKDLPEHTLDLLQAYDWPGNVRELQNIIARLIVFPETLSEFGASSSPPALPSSHVQLEKLFELPLLDARAVVVSTFERPYLEEKLRKHGGNIKQTAHAIDISRQSLHGLLEKYDLEKK